MTTSASVPDDLPAPMRAGTVQVPELPVDEAREPTAVARRDWLQWGLAFAAVQLFLLAALVWAMDDPLVVRIDVSGTRAVATVEGVALPLSGEAPDGAGLGVYFEAIPYRGREDLLDGIVRAVASPLLWLDADAAWQEVRVYGPDGTPIYQHDFSRGDASGWRSAAVPWWSSAGGGVTTGWTGFLVGGPPDWREGHLEAVLQRGHNPAGIVVRGDGERSGALVLVRPVHRDILWWQLRDGGWSGPYGGAAYTRPWDSALKDVIRLLLRPYFLALLFAFVCVVLGRAWVALKRVGFSRLVPAVSGGASANESRIHESAVAGAAIGLAIVTFASTAMIADVLLQRMPHVQDSVAYLFQAKTFALGRLWMPLPQISAFFEHEFIVMKDGRWFSKYPPGFPALLSLGVLTGVPWLVNPAAAALTSLTTYLLGRRVAGSAVGLIAAVLLLTSPFFLFLAGSFMSHTTGLLFIALFAWLYIQADAGRRWAGPLAGFAIGFDFLIRPWTAIVLALPFGVDLALRLRRAPRSTSLLFGALASGAALPLAVWLGYNTVLAGGPLNNTMELWWSFDKLGFGPDKGIFGHTPLNGLYNTVRNLSELTRHLFGWPAVATFALAAVPFVTFRASRWDRIWLASSLALMAGYFFWWADGVMYGPRFYHELTVFVVLLSARGIQVLVQLGRAPGRVLVGAALAMLFFMNFTLYLPVQLPTLRGYNFVSRDSLDAVQAAQIHHAIVFTDPGLPNEWWHYGKVFSANSPLLDTDVIYARDLGPLNDQLMALYPDRRYYRLYRTKIDEIRPGQ